MRAATSTSLSPALGLAIAEALEGVQAGLGGAPAHVATIFVSGHTESLQPVHARTICDALGTDGLLGCAAESVIGGAVEHEGTAALVLWAASLPGARITAARLEAEGTPDGVVLRGWPEDPVGRGGVITLGDPFSFPMEALLRRHEEGSPGAPVVGGMASAAREPGQNRLVLGREVHDRGAVAIFLDGAARIHPVVSQGCRPFGRHLVVTRADGNFIHALGGRPALEKLSEQLSSLTATEQGLLQRGLHIGLAIDARKHEHRRGDFLVRNVIGIHKADGALVVADDVRTGTTVQFHLRDAETASEDLDELLAEARRGGVEAVGALLFSCNGRGRRMFDTPSHDAIRVRQGLGDVPLAGFFAAGEIGPVGGRSFLHGFTASLALLVETGPEEMPEGEMP